MSITVSYLRDDLVDRLDGLVSRGALSRPVRNRLATNPRIYQAINNAVTKFVSRAPARDLSSLVQAQTTPALAVVATVNSRAFPADIFTSREDGGVVDVLINNEPFPVDEMVSMGQLVTSKASEFGGESAKYFHVNFEGRVLYYIHAEGAIRYVKKPTAAADGASIELDLRFASTIAELAFADLLTQVAAAAAEGNNE